MAFYRHSRIFIGFDCEDSDGNLHNVYGGELREVEFDPVEFSDRDEAYRLGGTLTEWAMKVAENVATSEATSYCGDETFHAVNITWDYSDEKEWSEVPEIPSYIRAAIQITLERIKENLDDIDYVKQLIKDLDKILKDNEMTRTDIEEMIKKLNLENILLTR